jgi:glycosyltransferase involved in cell wall biosynthesis
MIERDVLRNPIIRSERGSINAPEWVESIVKKNRDIWKNENNDFDNRIDLWTSEINLKMTQLRGDCSKNPKFSIVVPAHNEEEYILQLLDSISNQTNIEGGVETIVVVNDSDDRTAFIAEKCGVKVIDYKQDKPYPPVAYARQRGLEEAKGKYLLSTDADMLVGKNWVKDLTKPLVESDIVVVSGNIDFYDGAFIPQVTNPINRIFRRYEIYVNPKVEFAGFGNIAARKADIVEFGGWPQTPIKEDTYLIHKLTKTGRIVLSKDATIWTSGRRAMLPIKDILSEQSKGGNHFFDRDGRLKIVR